MEANTLVTHNKLRSLGIGCISKVMKSSYKVNFGMHDVLTCKKTSVTQVDTSKCKTIKFADLQRMSTANSPELPSMVIIGNEIQEYVGIGWITIGVVTHDDLSRYPRVID